MLVKVGRWLMLVEVVLSHNGLSGHESRRDARPQIFTISLVWPNSTPTAQDIWLVLCMFPGRGWSVGDRPWVSRAADEVRLFTRDVEEHGSSRSSGEIFASADLSMGL